MIISAILAIVIIALILRFIQDIVTITLVSENTEEMTYYIEEALNLVIGIELVKMLAKHSLSTVIEVLVFAIARQVIVAHLPILSSVYGIVAIAMLFAIRKYLFCEHDETEKTIYRATQKVRMVKALEHLDIPILNGETLGALVINELTQKQEVIGTGSCVYYKGFALRIAKMNQNEITRVEIIKTLH